MSLRSTLSSSIFRGIGAGAAKPKPKNDDDMSQEEKDRRARNKAAGRAEDDDGETDADRDQREKDEQAEKDRKAKNKAAGRAEDDDGDEDDDDDDDTKEKEDDEDEEEMRKDSKSRAIRMRERERCAAIFASRAAVGRLGAAAHLAFNTNTPRHQACALLATMPKEPAAGGLAARQAGQENRSAGSGGPSLTGQSKVIAEAASVFGRVAISPNAKRD